MYKYHFKTISYIIKIAIAGKGFMRLSNAVLLARHRDIFALDIILEKVDLINRRKSPIVDAEIKISWQIAS